MTFHRGSLAQLVEQLTLNQRVVGSIPTRSTMNFKGLAASVVRPFLFWDTGGTVGFTFCLFALFGILTNKINRICSKLFSQNPSVWPKLNPLVQRSPLFFSQSYQLLICQLTYTFEGKRTFKSV
jgi:hypothetical protein